MSLGEFMVSFYHNWTGRYSASFFWALFNPLNSDSWIAIYKWVGIVGIGLMITFVFVGFKLMSGPLVSLKKSIIFSLLFVLVYLSGISSVASTFYWFTVSAANTMGCIFLLLTFALVVTTRRSSTSKRKWMSSVASAIAIVITAGFYETVAILLIYALLVYTITLFVEGERGRYSVFILLIISTCSVAFSFSAPGNFSRASISSSPQPLDIIKFIVPAVKSLYFTFGKIGTWIFDPLLLITTYLTMPLLVKIGNSIKLRVSYNWVRLFFLVLLVWVGLSISVFPNFFLVNDVKPRVWDVVYFGFLIAWFGLVIYFLTCLYENKKFRWFLSSKIYDNICLTAKALIVFYFFVAQTSVVNNAYTDLIFRASEYSNAMIARYNYINDQPEEIRILTVKELLPRSYMYPSTIYLGDISEDALTSANQYYAKFFKLEKVRIEGKERHLSDSTVNFYDLARRK